MAEWFWALHLKSGDSEFKTPSDHQVDLFQVVSVSTPRLCLHVVNWSASCQLGFLTCILLLFVW